MDQSALRTLNQPGRLRAEFFFDEDFNREHCKITKVGDYSDIIKKVTPELIAQFPREWELYQKTSGRSDDDIVGGTPLREVPGVDRDAATVLRYNAVRNVEELAALDEQIVRGFGPGYLDFWRSAKLILQAREADQLRSLLAEHKEKPKRGPGRPRKEPEPEIEIENEPEQPDLGPEAA